MLKSQTKGHKSEGASLLHRTAEGAGTVESGEGKAEGDLINVSKCLRRGCREARDGLFSWVPSDRRKGMK